jgi:hypothetical protein
VNVSAASLSLTDTSEINDFEGISTPLPADDGDRDGDGECPGAGGVLARLVGDGPVEAATCSDAVGAGRGVPAGRLAGLALGDLDGAPVVPDGEAPWPWPGAVVTAAATEAAAAVPAFTANRRRRPAIAGGFGKPS